LANIYHQDQNIYLLIDLYLLLNLIATVLREKIN